MIWATSYGPYEYQYFHYKELGFSNLCFPTKKSLTSKLPSNGLEKFLRIVGNVNGKRTEVETGMNLSCRSIG